MEQSTFTVFCAMPSDPRGQYSEELDIQAPYRTRETAIRKMAQEILDRDYLPGLKIRRVVRRGPGLFI